MDAFAIDFEPKADAGDIAAGRASERTNPAMTISLAKPTMGTPERGAF
jgi:hypothetical protein